MPRRYCPIILSVLFAMGCGSSDSPSTPTPAATRILRLGGDLGFGDVPVGSSADRIIVISNDGNAPLTVTSFTAAAGGAFTASWASGTVPPAASQDVVIRFTPPAAQSYNGTLTVLADHTSGTNTMAITAAGVAATSTTSPPGNAPPTTTLPSEWPGPLPSRSSGSHPVCQATFLNNVWCDDNRVGRPQAICEDRSFSCSMAPSACSAHGGVYCWRD
jgi:hypothetical protein